MIVLPAFLLSPLWEDPGGDDRGPGPGSHPALPGIDTQRRMAPRKLVSPMIPGFKDAELLRKRFENACRRFGLRTGSDRGLGLDVTRFRVPGRPEQGSLFA